jgi:hypothetical protein
MLELIIRISAVALTVFIADLMLSPIGKNFIDEISGIFAMWGSISYFLLARYFTSFGFWVRGAYIDKATPEVVWKFMGIISWSIFLIFILVGLF